MEDAKRLLRDTFGYGEFRESQEAVLHRLLVDNKSAVVVFPTGGGKSLCYQIPGILLDGLTIIISPLLSLMKDQVDVLQRKKVHAASLDSTLDPKEAAAVKDGVRSGRLKLLYVAPERLNNEGFIRLLEGIKVSLLAVDEAHCVSEWGPSFRPEYLKVARFAKEINAERVLALTATATPAVVQDICQGFDIDETEGVFRTTMYRKNLHISTTVAYSLEEKINILVPKLNARKGPAIIYVTLQKQAETVMNMLQTKGVKNCKMYHAGMKNETRKEVQDWFMASQDAVVCATIAFAMGIDKNNIRQIHHLMLPKSLESWTQEIGRAGRDGIVSDCCLYLCPTDVPVLEGFARGDACSKMVLKNWLTAVFTVEPDEEDTLAFNLYQQSKDYDIRPSMLSLLFALLELDYSLLRARTPYYEIYNIKPKGNGLRKVLADDSHSAKAVRAQWRTCGQGYEINMVQAAEKSRVARSRLAGVISSWELEGYVTNTPSQVRAQFRLVKDDDQLPSTPEDIDRLAVKLEKTMLEREQKELERLNRVIGVATGTTCFAHALASYFGDEKAVPDGKCGTCSYCKTQTPLEFTPTHLKPEKRLIDAIAEACGVRDDSRALARMAFGISTPRLTSLGMHKDPLFGSCVDCDFGELLDEFEKICQASGHKNLSSTSKPPAKRAGSASSRGGAKRGRGNGR